jgi:ribose/xylose/arabinose/galactoside ABC-type transport system permease subunit
MITVARLSAADPIIDADLLLPSIAAAVMGGADLMGGRGSMLGAVIGALLIATLQAGLSARKPSWPAAARRRSAANRALPTACRFDT